MVKSIPYTNKPEEITPGVANYYASAYDGHDFVNVLVKTREGRPIFVKNNTETGYGKVNARVNASVLGLYDSARLQAPQLNGSTRRGRARRRRAQRPRGRAARSC